MFNSFFFRRLLSEVIFEWPYAKCFFLKNPSQLIWFFANWVASYPLDVKQNPIYVPEVTTFDTLGSLNFQVASIMNMT